MAAGIAALEALKSGEVHQKLESLGARLEKGMTEAAQEAGLPMTFQRSGSMFCGYLGTIPFEFIRRHGVRSRSLQTLLSCHAGKRCVCGTLCV